MNARRLGFSLMEMLMVLLVIALITLSFFTLKQSDMEVDKSEDLGYRLFEYGQALGDYLRNEGKNYAATAPDVLVIDGYEWLQTKGYLSNEFSLVVEPLFIDNIPDADTPIQTTIVVSHVAGTVDQYELVLDLVEIGPVYSRNDVKTDESGERTNVQDVSLISRAVNYANEYRDTLKGSGIIQYRRVEMGSEPPPPGSPPAPPEPFTGLSLIQGTTVDSSLWNDAWLLRNGLNTMEGPINFKTSLPTDSAINNINHIQFQSSGSVPGGTVSNVDTIDFTGTNRKINQISTIHFANGAAFQGIRILGSRYYPPTNPTQVLIDGKLAYASNSVCYISGVETGQNGVNCLLSTATTGGNPPHYHITVQGTSGGTNVSCTVACFNF